ncbi:LacI family transcriptional regulator [Algoriphagus ratkowskyi]|uniref:LacI family transcriptional regulator n=1 Tax=Algoriphagus ratkowskyi TaxID=57028 RepID=A0A2W7SEQ0_9BACT|nr:LacI family DNA-binding transcriptional regulator [Algoriphagus ratkowskyi]PZX61325.1 LacI family transcriptional regulator [Algoriphagus ratkowskyi]TXD79430.1 LacI family transcriptional regulator [Algoriphagus ratkowskyi]
MRNGKATIHDIAEKLKVTASTVSRALNDNPRISDATKKRVLKAAKDLNYQPNNIAAALRSGRSKLIGVVVPTANRNFFSSVIRGIEEFANSLNYKVVISQSYDDFEKEKQTIEALLNVQVDGIIASLGKTTKNVDHFKKIISKGIPLVLFDRVTNDLDVSQVVIDDYYGAFQATEHLITEGCRRILHFTSAQNINIYKDRKRGYEDALLKHGIGVDPELILFSDMQLEDGRRIMQETLDRKIEFDAVFSSSDYSVMGAMQVLKENGLNIPQDVKLVGFGNEPFTSFTEPTLTTVDQKSIPMGQITAETFFEILNQKDQGSIIPKKTILKPELIIRNSSINKEN